MIAADAIGAFASVVAVDVLLAGDNAIVVGAIAANLRRDQRRKVIAVGTILALAFRIAFALTIAWLLNVPGVVLVGGVLLLVVAARMWADLQGGDGVTPAGVSPSSFARAIVAVAVADASMSLDNVLAVAAVAHTHPWALGFGLVLSVALMGIGANIVAGLIGRYRWLAYVGLGLIVAVALRMVWDGCVIVAAVL